MLDTGNIKDEIARTKEQYAEQQEEKVKYDVELKALFREIRRASDTISSIKKEIDGFKKEYKHEEK
jgi:predicted  nucleic acid-binding Zn-ribbon protein